MKRPIISISVNEGTREEYVSRINEDISAGISGYCCFSNVHMLIEAYDDPAFAEVVNSARYAFPDGFPVARSFKILHGVRQERIAGMDFFPHFLGVSDERKYKVALIGSTPEILEQAKEKIANEFPGLTLTHLISPPFGQPWDNAGYIEQLNSSGTQVVFVALGCPKQEKWMYDHSSQIQAMLFGIGGALPTYVGAVGRAPAFMRNNGLEWLYRLIKEPRRMFRRYLYTNTKFLWLLLRESVK